MAHPAPKHTPSLIGRALAGRLAGRLVQVIGRPWGLVRVMLLDSTVEERVKNPEGVFDLLSHSNFEPAPRLLN